MSGSNPGAAVRAFLTPLQLSLSCVTKAVIDIGGGVYPRERPHRAALMDGLPVRLVGASRLFLAFEHHYRIGVDASRESVWTVQTVGYSYALRDSGGREIIAYHDTAGIADHSTGDLILLVSLSSRRRRR